MKWGLVYLCVDSRKQLPYEWGLVYLLCGSPTQLAVIQIDPVRTTLWRELRSALAETYSQEIRFERSISCKKYTKTHVKIQQILQQKSNFKIC